MGLHGEFTIVIRQLRELDGTRGVDYGDTCASHQACLSQVWNEALGIDNDYRGAALAGEVELEYPQRSYICPSCQYDAAGYEVVEKSPPEFFLQPHNLYPMRRREFNRWVAVLEENFPAHSALQELGKSFYPGLEYFSVRDWFAARWRWLREALNRSA